MAGLDLDPQAWEDELLERPPRPVTGPDGQPATLTDTVVRIRRRR